MVQVNDTTKVKGHFIIYLRGCKEQICKMEESVPVHGVEYRWLK